jgi:hypothetical protein
VQLAAGDSKTGKGQEATEGVLLTCLWPAVRSYEALLHGTHTSFMAGAAFTFSNMLHVSCFPCSSRCCCCLCQSPEALERNQLAWLAFGAGPRLCIGYKFALNEAKTVLVSLWQRYDFALDPQRTAEPPLLRPGITLGYRDGLWCKVLPRS